MPDLPVHGAGAVPEPLHPNPPEPLDPNPSDVPEVAIACHTPDTKALTDEPSEADHVEAPVTDTHEATENAVSHHAPTLGDASEDGGTKVPVPDSKPPLNEAVTPNDPALQASSNTRYNLRSNCTRTYAHRLDHQMDEPASS